MKGTTEASRTDAPRRGLFRRTRRADDVEAFEPYEDVTDATLDAVATVDELARRMDELATTPSLADEPVRAELDLQRALIARANDISASGGAALSGTPNVALPSNSPTTPTPNATSVAPEATVQQPASIDTTDALTTDDIEARLDAALQPVQTPVVEPAPTASVTLEPTMSTAMTTPEAPAAELRATMPITGASSWSPAATTHGAAAAIGIDVDRLVQLIEDEAAGVQARMQLEVQTAHAQAEEIIDRAEGEAERIREHGQAQARVLLGEVEEIISEAQQTGEQILLRANEESSSLRKDATAVLQQAQTEARAIVETARREGEQVLAEQRRLATVRAQEAMREQDRLKDQIRRLEERRRQVLESLEPLISQLTQMMPAGIDHNVVPIQRTPQG